MEQIFSNAAFALFALLRLGRSQGFAIIALGLLLTGCAITASEGRTIYEHPVTIVRL